MRKAVAIRRQGTGSGKARCSASSGFIPERDRRSDDNDDPNSLNHDLAGHANDGRARGVLQRQSQTFADINERDGLSYPEGANAYGGDAD